MPHLVSRSAQRVRLCLLASPLLALIVFGLWHGPVSRHDEGCLRQGDSLVVCAASDMARISRRGYSRLEHARFDLVGAPEQRLRWKVARNETVSFQLILRSENLRDAASVAVDLPESDIHASLFQAHYIQLDRAGYSWGPRTEVLPWPAAYPDALIPRDHQCKSDTTRLFDTIKLPRRGSNQSVWIDLYVPDDLPPGQYEQVLTIQALSRDAQPDETAEALELTLAFEVIDATIPHQTSIDAVGEIYRSYRLEAAGEDRSQAQWQRMAHCYQMLAHQHRMVFIERTPDTPQDEQQWRNYTQTHAAILDGSLFDPRHGYVGSGTRTPVSIWRTPWPQQHDIIVDKALSAESIAHYESLARRWTELVHEQRWYDTRFFAYVFDEVDGPSSRQESDPQRHHYIKRVHADMHAVQQAIDRGSASALAPDTLSQELPGDKAAVIDLVWTSHSDPAIWQDDPETTLVGRTRLWAPNAHAANTDFLAKRIAEGERAWFYHSGHPAVGGHSINLPGSDLRSWGVIGARYGLQGQLMWAVNLGNDDLPFAQPSYKPEDDRIGNGVLVYPGYQLPRIGFPAARGPIPSMRLKAWFRGLQDAELYFMARERDPVRAEALIRELVPSALQEAVATGATTVSWPRDAASWIHCRDQLIAILDD